MKYLEFNLFIYVYIYSGSSTIILFKYIKTQCIFIKMTSFDEVVIMLHKFYSNSEHTFFTLRLIFGFLLKFVSCDKRLILKERLTIIFNLCDTGDQNPSLVVFVFFHRIIFCTASA